MKNRCFEFEESLLLSVYGEASGENMAFQEHLAKCTRCQRRKGELMQLLEKVREGWQNTHTTYEGSEKLLDKILRRLEDQGIKRRVLFDSLPAPALAAVFMVLLTVGVMFWGPWRPYEVKPGLSDLDQGLVAERMEFFEEMEVLEEMDLLQKLVRLVDREGPVM